LVWSGLVCAYILLIQWLSSVHPPTYTYICLMLIVRDVTTVLFATAVFIYAKPLRQVRDVNSVAWEEYFDEKTQHFYYHHPPSGSTSWLLDFPAKQRDNKDRGVEGRGKGSASRDAFKRVEDPWDSDSDASDIIDEMFPVVSKSKRSSGIMPLYPVDAHELHLARDPAGRLRKQRIFTIFDQLKGVKARINFPMSLKAPVAFHHMFLQSDGASSISRSAVDSERGRLEAALRQAPDSADTWESLGHVWRVYGDVERTIDCYRRALEIGPPDKPSLYINLAGMLDQMDFIQDALDVLRVMMDTVDVISVEAEANLALGYIMAAQLQVRARNLTEAARMVDAAIELQPHFYSAIVGLKQEIHYRNYSFGGPPWLFGGMGAWATEKDPWLLFRWAEWLISLLGGGGLVGKMVTAATTWPLVSLMIRKVKYTNV